MGGSETDPGIFINWSLRLGTTASRCITFDKFWPISRDLVFDIRILELWVVNEVLIKKSSIPKRDFYSTVVMWNRIGKHKTRARPDDHKKHDSTECCCHSGMNAHEGNAQCSHMEVHETEQRHFEPSNPSLSGNNAMDDELLIAIKNRLAGLPAPAGPLSPTFEDNALKTNPEMHVPPTKFPYQGISRLNKVKKVSTQVDDSMITEIKHQGTSTSRIKVTSTYTQSGVGLTPLVEGKAQVQQLTSTMQQVNEGCQRLLLHEEKAVLQQSVSRTQQNNEGVFPSRPDFQISERCQGSLPTLRDSFSIQRKHALPSQMSSQIPHPSSPIDMVENILHPLPEVPEYYGESSQRPSLSRSIGSNSGEASYQQLQERSWPGRRNMGAILPYQQQLVRAPPDRPSPITGSPYSVPYDQQTMGPAPFTRSTPPPPQQQQYPHPTYPPPPYRTPSSQPNRVDEHAPNLNRDYPSPSKSLRRVYENRTSPSRSDRFDPAMIPPGREPSEQQQPPPYPPPDDPTVVAMATQMESRTNVGAQLCRCGSKQLNIVCSCKRPEVKQVVCEITEEACRECKCSRSDRENSKDKRKKKDKKGKPDKEAKAEEKRRRKEEKEREKREKKEQKAREKERKKSKSKGEKKRKSNGDKGDCRMCQCCKCSAGDERDTTVPASENSCTSYSEDKGKKKSKKEKKPKEKKKKNKETKNDCEEEAFKSCRCPPICVEQETSKAVHSAPLDSSCRMSNQEMEELAARGEFKCCNHPEFPCPALLKSEKNCGQESRPGIVCIQSPKSSKAVTYSQPTTISKENCGDTACSSYMKRNNSQPQCCTCQSTRLCNGNGTKIRCIANVAQVEQPSFPARMDGQSSSPNIQPTATQNNPYYSTGETAEAERRYGNVTIAPALVVPNEIGKGDTNEPLTFSGRSPKDPRFRSLTSEFCPSTNVTNLRIDTSKKGPENEANKHYVPPCVLYLDCTKVKDLCVIIREKYEDPS